VTLKGGYNVKISDKIGFTKFRTVEISVISQMLMCSEDVKGQSDPCYVYHMSSEHVTN
jgi:hypothetical protein